MDVSSTVTINGDQHLCVVIFHPVMIVHIMVNTGDTRECDNVTGCVFPSKTFFLFIQNGTCSILNYEENFPKYVRNCGMVSGHRPLKSCRNPEEKFSNNRTPFFSFS